MFLQSSWCGSKKSISVETYGARDVRACGLSCGTSGQQSAPELAAGAWATAAPHCCCIFWSETSCGGPGHMKCLGRCGGVAWGHGDLALLYESWYKTRRSRVWAIAPDGGAAPRLVWDRDYEDAYGDPGSPLARRTALGTYVLAQVEDTGELLLQGAAHREGFPASAQPALGPGSRVAARAPHRARHLRAGAGGGHRRAAAAGY